MRARPPALKPSRVAALKPAHPPALLAATRPLRFATTAATDEGGDEHTPTSERNRTPPSRRAGEAASSSSSHAAAGGSFNQREPFVPSLAVTGAPPTMAVAGAALTKPGGSKPARTALKPSRVAALKPAHPTAVCKPMRAPSPPPSPHASRVKSPRRRVGLKPTRVKDGLA